MEVPSGGGGCRGAGVGAVGLLSGGGVVENRLRRDGRRSGPFPCRRAKNTSFVVADGRGRRGGNREEGENNAPTTARSGLGPPCASHRPLSARGKKYPRPPSTIEASEYVWRCPLAKVERLRGAAPPCGASLSRRGGGAKARRRVATAIGQPHESDAATSTQIMQGTPGSEWWNVFL